MTDESDSSDTETQKLVQEQNKKSKNGGFNLLGLSFKTVKAVTKKGYKLPTPIQRKAIPLILDKRDVVAMARTGSGKTAAFLLPTIDLLKEHKFIVGVRCLILSPTRELAIQTMKFAKDFTKGCDLRISLILGGDSLSEQFQSLHDNPDIVIATPGRFVHLVHEMNLKLSSVEVLICDEADRLFEMGFAEQLNEICKRLPNERQTVLFSATLPSSLVEFARAGLKEPILVRLDLDCKLNEGLKTVHIRSSEDNKWAVLLHLLQFVVNIIDEQTVIFFPTKHHIEYCIELLNSIDIPCAHIFSSLDQTARKINAAKFYTKKVNVLLVTDIAARGIDVPLLDNVINFNLPAKPKLFVHRVGRVARAGKTGTAYSLVAGDEVGFLYDLYLYLGKDLHLAQIDSINHDSDCLGILPQVFLDAQNERIGGLHKSNCLLPTSLKTCQNGLKHYIRSRGHPAAESVDRAKELKNLTCHPVFPCDNSILEQESWLQQLHAYRGKSTIFEVNKSDKSECQEIMKRKRQIHDKFKRAPDSSVQSTKKMKIDTANTPVEGDIESSFVQIIKPSMKDDAYIPYERPGNQDVEDKALSIGFDKESASASFNLTGDDADMIRKQKSQLKWDQKKKKYARNNPQDKSDEKLIRAEDGSRVKASYKTGRYKDWVSKAKKTSLEIGEKEDSNDKRSNIAHKRGWHYSKSKTQTTDIKSVDKIIKNRKQAAKNKAKNMKKSTRINGKSKSFGGGKSQKKGSFSKGKKK